MSSREHKGRAYIKQLKDISAAEEAGQLQNRTAPKRPCPAICSAL